MNEKLGTKEVYEVTVYNQLDEGCSQQRLYARGLLIAKSHKDAQKFVQEKFPDEDVYGVELPIYVFPSGFDNSGIWEWLSGKYQLRCLFPHHEWQELPVNGVFLIGENPMPI